jgi:hypothetical protein
MDFLQTITPLIFTIGQTLGVGASTFALLFYIMAAQDGVVDSSEKRFMRAVYVVLRIGMAVITIALALKFFLGTFMTPVYLSQIGLLGVISLNAYLMTKRLISMRFGPVLAGGSWYSLFLVSTLPLSGVSFVKIVIGYGLFLILFYAIFSLAKSLFLKR